MKSFSESYKNAGVDVTAGYESVKLMKEHVERTRTKGVLSGLGGFGGMFELPQGYKNPVLVSGTDGVGTKLKLAFLMNKHDTIGIDAVAMCVNDIVCAGAKPLFFLDYIAVGKNYPEQVAQIVKGIADGCQMSGCALIGGETAEMPGFYPVGEYDVAGYATGIVEKSKILDSANVRAGDIVLGLASSGVHSNGFSLVRKVFNLSEDVANRHIDELGGTIGQALLEPTKIYVKSVLALLEKVEVKSISHITGGGFYENIPRALPDDLTAKIDLSSFEIPEIFKLIASTGRISQRDMFNTFNMGIGMVIVVSKDEADTALSVLNSCGEDARIIGEIISSDEGVIIE